jgi:hypothetical protein
MEAPVTPSFFSASMASSSSLTCIISMPEGSRFPHHWRFARLRRQGGSMVFDVKPEVFPPKKVGGEFI